MARKLNEDWESLGVELWDGQLLTRATCAIQTPEPLTQEWFRGHPQWFTDRLMDVKNPAD
jgi:hypothetical protein